MSFLFAKALVATPAVTVTEPTVGSSIALAPPRSHEVENQAPAWEFPKRAVFFKIDVAAIVATAPLDDYGSQLRLFIEEFTSKGEAEVIVAETVLELIKGLKEPPEVIEIDLEEIKDLGEKNTTALIGGLTLGILAHYRQKKTT